MEFRLAEHGLVLLTRDRGSTMRAELLADLPPTDTVVIDFDEVLSASYSFLDEFVGVLVEELSPRRPELINVPQTILETIARSLRRRGLDPSIAASLEAA
jgi:STAS-like domain of unknown function (DUF4325)